MKIPNDFMVKFTTKKQDLLQSSLEEYRERVCAINAQSQTISENSWEISVEQMMMSYGYIFVLEDSLTGTKLGDILLAIVLF